MRLDSFRRRGFLLQFLSSVSLLLNSGCQAMAVTSTNNCAIVGVGVLGTSLCQQILESNAEKLRGIHVTGITKSTSRHDEIRQQMGASASRLELTTTEQATQDETKFDHVVFCAPPSGFDDYAGAVQHAATTYWKGQGSFVFTSSGGM